MREIKFRIWDSILGFYVKVENYFLRNSKIYYDNCGYYVDQTKTLILEQYTGLKDKNGKKIYEGDKFNINGKIMFVRYIEDHGRYVLTTGNGYDTRNCVNLDCDIIHKKEIIGNIHEGEYK